MNIDLFRSIIRQVAPITEQVCFHLMGDPLVHPKLSELVEICREESVKIFFVTNGVLLRPDKAELLLDPAFRQVNFSLHSFADNFGDQDPSTYLEKIFAYTERAFSQRPDLYINYRLWNLADPRGKKPHNQRMLDQIRDRFGIPPEGEEVLRLLDVRVQKSIRLKNRLYLHFDTEFTWPSLDLPRLGTTGTCYGLTSHFGILVDGTVVPCCLDKEGAIPLGDVRTTPLIEILESPKALAMLKGFKERRLVEELCQHCPYIERFN